MYVCYIYVTMYLLSDTDISGNSAKKKHFQSKSEKPTENIFGGKKNVNDKNIYNNGKILTAINEL